MRFDGKTNKQRAKTMRVTELSGVTVGAHEGAKVTLMKFKTPEDFLKSVYTETLREEVVEDKVYDHLEPMWAMNRALREAAEQILLDDSITDKQAAMRESVMDYLNGVLALFTTTMEATQMADKNPELETLRADLMKAQASVEQLTAISKLNDASKAHYETLDESAQADFLALSQEDQSAIVKVSDESYTTVDGSVIAKSAVGAAYDVIKAQDVAMRKLQDEQSFSKAREQVSSTIPNVPGEVIAKTKAWQAMEALPAEAREFFESTLKAADELWKARKAPAGDLNGAELDAEGKLEKLAKEAAAADGVSFAKAYANILKSADGQALLAEMEG